MNKTSLKTFFLRNSVFIITELYFLLFLFLNILPGFNRFYSDMFTATILLSVSETTGFHISKLAKRNWTALIIQLCFSPVLLFPFYKISSADYYTRSICLWGIVLAFAAADFFVLSYVHGKDKFGKVIFFSIIKAFFLSLLISLIVYFIIAFSPLSSYGSFILITFFPVGFSFLFAIFSGRRKKTASKVEDDEKNVQDDSKENDDEIMELMILTVLGLFVILTYVYIFFMLHEKTLKEIQTLPVIIIFGYMVSYFLLKELSGNTRKFFFKYGNFFVLPIYVFQVVIFVQNALNDGLSTNQLVELYFYIVVFVFFVLTFIKTGKFSHFLLPVTSVLILISTTTPLNCQRLAVRNHLYRIEKIYKQHNLYRKTPEGKIYFDISKADEILSDAEKQQIALDYEYFNWTEFNNSGYQSFLKNSFLEGKEACYISEKLFQELCGFDLEKAKNPKERIKIK